MEKRSVRAIGLLLAWAGLGLAALPARATEYTTPRALAIGDTYKLVLDGYWFTGASETTCEPKVDANDGSCYQGHCDNPYFQRHNVVRGHDYGNCPRYWYTQTHQYSNEPDLNGPQWVDYKPPLSILGAGRYRIIAQYRSLSGRAPYPAQYIVTAGNGSTTTVGKVQSQNPTGECE